MISESILNRSSKNSRTMTQKRRITLMMKVKRGKKKKKKKRRKKRRSELGPYQLVEALGNQPIECMPNLKLSIKMNSLGCSAIIKR